MSEENLTETFQDSQLQNEEIGTKALDISVLQTRIKALEQANKIKEDEVSRLKNLNKTLSENNIDFVNRMKDNDTHVSSTHQADLDRLLEENVSLKNTIQTNIENHERIVSLLKIELEEAERRANKIEVTESSKVLDSSKSSNLEVDRELINSIASERQALVDSLRAEIVSLKASLVSEQTGREAALSAWENAERKLSQKRAVSDESEIERLYRTTCEDKRAVERTLDWTTEQLRRAENRLHLLEADFRIKSEECTSAKIKLGSIYNESKSQLEMENIKTQVLVESIKSEMDYRERVLQNQISGLTDQLNSSMLEKLKLEKGLKATELNYTEQLQYREQLLQAQYAKSMQLSLQSQIEQARYSQDQAVAVPRMGAQERELKKRELEAIEEQIANYKSVRPPSIAKQWDNREPPLASKLAKMSENRKSFVSQNSVNNSEDLFEADFWGEQKIPAPGTHSRKAADVKKSNSNLKGRESPAPNFSSNSLAKPSVKPKNGSSSIPVYRPPNGNPVKRK